MPQVKELSLVKGAERFMFRYASGSEEDVLDAFVATANDRQNNFDWFDAAVLSFQLSKHLVEEADALLAPKDAQNRNGSTEQTKTSWGSS
jgi:hypothetical protein